MKEQEFEELEVETLLGEEINPYDPLNPDLQVREDLSELNKLSDGFLLAGMIAVGAGVTLFSITNLELLGWGVFPFALAGGITAIGWGISRVVKEVFRKKSLNLPTIKLKRKKLGQVKVKPKGGRFGLDILSKLWRSRKEREILGVCGGIAEYLGKPVGTVRFLAILAFFFSGGIAGIAYMALGFILPEKK